ncbi:exophilin-5-like isoform X1 [Chelonoidis abingdonii]|uniref:exophilin-5-like isoform X1 n=1 Tax=Chelonoidis abingdonii TaxID=106734 RepID=UPI0013F19428|nr:exophilin-5-like isoform X1 [Chelonoidis abingdonii]
MAGAPRGLDLTFLSEQEARQIFQVLERDAELKRAEKDRISKLQKKKRDVTGLQGVTGEWFEEIQRKKFQNEIDVNRMLKRPLAHWLRKTSRNDPKEFKMSSPQNPQAQKNVSPSILGFRTPFTSLFSFKKSRKHSLKHQTQQQPRYDSFALGTHTSFKVQEMAQAETCNSSLPAERPGNLFDATQAEMMEHSAPVWNEQLEKEFFSVLDDLDDQLAQEQAQDSVNRTHLVDSGPRAQYVFPSTSRQTAIRGQHRNNCSETPSTFFSDATRTIRAKEDHKIFYRPRKFYDTYMNRYHSESKEYMHKDSLDSSYPVLSRRLSSVSFGESSEGSLHLPSIRQNNGFGHKSYMVKGTAGRSYSVCSLQKYPSSASSEPFSTTSLQNLLAMENNSGFVRRNNRQTPKRIPLSSIVWNKPYTSGRASNQDNLSRTQSLMECNARKQDTYPCPLHENRKYEFYRSKHHYRRDVSSTNWFSSVSCPDKAATSLSFDNWENYPLCWLENNLSRSHYRDTACHGRFQIDQKSSPFGRKEEHPSWSDIYQYYNDEVFLSPDAHYEMITSNLNDKQSAHAKNAKFASQCHQSDFQTCVSENRSSVEISSGANSKLLSKNSKDPQNCLTYKSAVTSTRMKADVSNESVLLGSRFKMKLVAENSSSATKVSQSQPQPLVTQMNIKKDFKKAASDKIRDLELSGEADQKSIKDIILHPVSQKVDTKNTVDPQICPSNNAAALQNSTSLLNSPLSLSSRRQTQLTATREITKNNISKSCKRNLQRKENDLPAHSELNQTPSLLSADESRRESFLSNLKQWEHHLINSAKRKGIKLGSRRTETTDHITPKEESFQVDVLQSSASVHSAPVTETLANHQSILPSPPELLSHSSQDSLQVFSHKSYLKSLETPTNSSVNCRVTEAPAEGGKVVELAGVVAKDIPQEKPKDQNILVSKDHNSQLTTGGSQNRNCGNIYACSFDKGPEIAERSLNYFCLERENGKTRQNASCIERLYRQGSLLRHTNSSSISGSPVKSNPESPEPLVIYYTLPRKSASIASSVMSGMSICFPKSKTATWDHVEKQNSDRAAAFSFNQGNKISSLGSAHSSIRPIPLHGITDIKENVLQIKDHPLPLNRSPNHSLSGRTVVSESEREKLVNKKESPVFSDCLEKEMGDSLQKYKTISTFTVSGDEDHIEYHELVSIYYTLPRSHSRTLCNLFLDDPEITPLSLYTEKSKSPKMPNKNSEVLISLANVAFPSTLEKERHLHSPDQTPAASTTPQNAKTGAVDTYQESSHFSSSTEEVCTSQSRSIVHNKKDISPGLALKESTLVLPDMVTSDTSVHDPESTTEADTSIKAISTASHNQNMDICFSSGKESKEKENILHTDTPLTSSLSTPQKHKDPPENVFNFTSAINNTNSLQIRDSKNCQQFIKVKGSNNQNILPLQLDKNSSHEGKSHRAFAVNNTPATSAESKSRHDAGAKERSDFQHQSISLCNNKCTGFLLGVESSRNSTDEKLISDRKMLPDSQNKQFQLGTVSAAKPILQPAKIGIPDTHDLVSRKTKQEQISLNTQMDKDCTSLQKAVLYSEDRQNVESKDKLSSVTQDLQLLQSAVSENKLMSDGTREKVSDIEKRKNRPSVKNEVAAIYKTRRKFSSKNVNPKPHVSNIFSQNDGGTTSLEINMTHSTLHSPASTQPFLQPGNEDQNQNLTPGVCDSPVHKISEKKRSQTNDDSSLLVKNKNQGPFANSYNQRRELKNPKQNENEVESILSPTTLFPKEIAARSKNSQTLGQGLENRNQTIFSRATEADSLGNQKRTSTGGSSHDPPLLTFLTDKNSNTFIKNLQANVCSQKQALSSDECDHDQNPHQSKSLKNANLHSNQSRMSRAKNQRERHFSESTCTQDSHDNPGSGSNCLPKESRYSRKFKSYSELCSYDENENWASYDERTTTYGTRRVMYPSIEFGIFGKEQQLAFLENIKRSLTEGRLWRPCLLKNPGFLRNEESDSLKRAELLNSSSAGSKISVDASSPRDSIDIYREKPMVYSDSDTDTTTDDEYYLCETDKESEL